MQKVFKMRILTVEGTMSKMIIGALIGATCTALVTCGSAKCLKRAKKMITVKLENLLK